MESGANAGLQQIDEECPSNNQASQAFEEPAGISVDGASQYLCGDDARDEAPSPYATIEPSCGGNSKDCTKQQESDASSFSEGR